jgi:hypothetical protein
MLEETKYEAQKYIGLIHESLIKLLHYEIDI